MKKDIHPENYRLVVFKDMSNDYAFLGKSTAETADTIAWEDGNEYPLIKLEISHKSHPFFTGKMQFVDTAGRIDKFRNKYAKWDKKKAVAQEEPANEEPKAEEPAVEAAAEEAPVVEETAAVEETPAVEEAAPEAAAEEAPAEEAPAAEEGSAEAEGGEEEKSE